MKSSTGLTTLARGVVAFAIVAVGLGVDGSVEARRPRPRPLPAPAAAIVSNIVIDEGSQGTFRIENPDEFGVDYIVKIVGPPPEVIEPFPGITSFGFVAGREGLLTGLSPSTPYTVTVFRHRFYDTRTNQAVNLLSAPTSFSFVTPSLAATRPSTPAIRISDDLGTGVLLNWAGSTDNVSAFSQIRYTYQVAGDPTRRDVPTCLGLCFGQTGVFIPRPARGASIAVTVTAIDAAGLRSLPSNAVTITG